MPFASKSQMRACFAKDDPNWDCHQWAHETPNRKNLPDHVKKKNMKFKEFLDQGDEIVEGKVGRWLGRAAGLAIPTLGGAAMTAGMMGTPTFDAGGAPGGLGGALAGVMKGGDIGAAIGDDLGDKVWSGVKKLGGLFRPKQPSTTQNYVNKLSSHTGLDPDDVEVKAASTDPADKGSELNTFMLQRSKNHQAGSTLQWALRHAGYPPSDIKAYGMNLSPDNKALRTWAMHYHQMVQDEMKAGHSGTAAAIAKRGVEKLQELGILNYPKAQPVTPEPTQYMKTRLPQSEPNKAGVIGELPDEQVLPKKKRRSRRKKNDQQPSLFDDM